MLGKTLTPKKLAYHRNWKKTHPESVKNTRKKVAERKDYFKLCRDCPNPARPRKRLCGECLLRVLTRQAKPENLWKRTQAHRKLKYGLSLERYVEMLFEQNGRCAVCKEFLGNRIHTDHDHKTNTVRGLLCSRCNTGLWFLENSGLAEKATEYLERTKNGPVSTSSTKNASVRRWVLK